MVCSRRPLGTMPFSLRCLEIFAIESVFISETIEQYIKWKFQAFFRKNALRKNFSAVKCLLLWPLYIFFVSYCSQIPRATARSLEQTSVIFPISRSKLVTTTARSLEQTSVIFPISRSKLVTTTARSLEQTSVIFPISRSKLVTTK